LAEKRMALDALNLTVLNLATGRPAIPSKSVLLIDAIHDLMAPKEASNELWQAWRRPDLWGLPHGHISITCMSGHGAADRVLRWLALRLNRPAVRTDQTPQ